MIGRLSDDAVHAAVGPTLRSLHATPDGEWSAQVMSQLIAVVDYVERRPADPAGERAATLAAALDRLRANPLVPDDGAVEERAAAALTAAVGVVGADADAVRAALRPPLLSELDDELRSTMTMMDGFRGRVREP